MQILEHITIIVHTATHISNDELNIYQRMMRVGPKINVTKYLIMELIQWYVWRWLYDGMLNLLELHQDQPFFKGNKPQMQFLDYDNEHFPRIWNMNFETSSCKIWISRPAYHGKQIDTEIRWRVRHEIR